MGHTPHTSRQLSLSELRFTYHRSHMARMTRATQHGQPDTEVRGPRKERDLHIAVSSDPTTSTDHPQYVTCTAAREAVRQIVEQSSQAHALRINVSRERIPQEMSRLRVLV